MIAKIPQEHESRVRLYETNQSSFIGFGFGLKSKLTTQAIADLLEPGGYRVSESERPEELHLEADYLEVQPPMSDEAIQKFAEFCVSRASSEKELILVIDNRQEAPKEQDRLAVGTVIASSRS